MRATMLWLALHAFLFAVSGGDVIALDTRAMIVLGVIGPVVGQADTLRRHEYGMLGNLGISKHVPAATWASTMIILEVVLRVSSHFAGVHT